MNVVVFITTVVLVTASGALTPGPLFFATLSHGTRFGAKSGFIFSIAHTIIEFSLVMLLALGLLAVANLSLVRLVIGFAGGVVLLIFGVMQVYNAFSPRLTSERPEHVDTRNLFLIGLAFTGLNPFFIIWWLTAGANLILLSLEFASIAGVCLMYVCHVWMDYLWLTVIAHFAKVGMNVVGFKWYRVLVAFFGIVLIYFGFTFILNSFNG